MSALLAYSAGTPGLLWAWTPDVLGASLLAWWDAERSDLIAQSGGAVSSWTDIVGGYAATQAVGASKPTYSATSFNGSPGVAFDGTDDELTVSSYPGTFPTDAAPCEIWACTDQQALAADTTVRMAASLGASSSFGRSLDRTVSSGVNRATARVGDGSPRVVTLGSVDFSGRHVARQIADGAQIFVESDGVGSSAGNCVPTTTGTRFRLGANPSSSASSFWQGVHSSIVVTSLLSTGQATQLYAYLNRRL